MIFIWNLEIFSLLTFAQFALDYNLKDFKNSFNYTKGDVVLRCTSTLIRRTALKRYHVIRRKSHDHPSVTAKTSLGSEPQST